MANPDWSKAVLKAGGWPQSTTNVQALNEWQDSEGGPADNPLNIGPGKHYGSPEAAAAATASLLRSAPYKSISGTLMLGQTKSMVIDAIILSPWEGNHYKGTDFGKKFTGGTGGGILSGVADLVPNAGAVKLAADAPSPLDVIKNVYDIIKFIPKLAAWILNPHNWIRIIEGVLGFIAIFVGLGQLGNQQVTDVAKKIPGLVMKGA